MTPQATSDQTHRPDGAAAGTDSMSAGGHQGSSSYGRRAEVVDDLAKRGHEAVDSVADKVDSIQHKAEQASENLSRKTHETADHAREAWEQNSSRVKSFAKENPLTAAGISFAAGVVISALLRR